MSECPSCGYASANGHAPLCLWGHSVEGPHQEGMTEGAKKPDAGFYGSPHQGRQNPGTPIVRVDTRDTSREAYRSISGDLPRLEGVVLEFIRRSDGATDDEIEAGTGLPHQTASARRNGLMRRGLIRVASDEWGEPLKRQTRSGRKAFVWVAA
mgnify:CR=1 FL=1